MTHVVVPVSAVLPFPLVAWPVLLFHLDIIADAVTPEPAFRRAIRELISHRNAHHSRLGVLVHISNNLSYMPEFYSVACHLD